MSFARRALYFPNGSSLYSRVKKGSGQSEKVNQGPLLHTVRRYFTHIAPSWIQGEPESGFSIECPILFFEFMRIPLYEVR